MRIRFHNLEALKQELVRRNIRTVWWDVRKEYRTVEDVIKDQKVIHYIVVHNLILTASDGKDLLYALHTILSHHNAFQGDEKIREKLIEALEKAKKWVEEEFKDYWVYQGEIIEV